VNGFSFNKQHGTFYSYGSDGGYTSWNKDTRAKYRASELFPGAIVAADLVDDGTMFAYAIGYDWARGFEGQKD
jgi:mRNA export factor